MLPADNREIMKLYIDKLERDDFEHPTDRVLLANDLVHTANRIVRDEVERARNAGVTGTELGSALGVTRQAVYMRFPVSVDA